jgi:predicted aminopeptidase
VDRFRLLPLGFLAAAALSGCYVLKQGTFLIAYNSRAVKIERILARKGLHEDVEAMLRLVREAKRFAVEELGLRADRNYSRYVELDRAYLVDVVSAAAPDSLTPYLWRFPFFGSFPYKGYYVRKDALREARRLERRGFDVWVRKVDAFSTLGFFSDPVYSFMSDYSPFDLASLIIHEQTHATLFVKNAVQFNEELATFVGWEGALEFLRSRFGEDSREYGQAVDHLADWRRFNEMLLTLYEELERAYGQAALAAGGAAAAREAALQAKGRLVAEFNRAAVEEPFRTESFAKFNGIPANNAYILAVVNYNQDLDLFYRLQAALGGDLRRTFQAVREAVAGKADPKEALRRTVESLERGAAADVQRGPALLTATVRPTRRWSFESRPFVSRLSSQLRKLQ